MLELAEGVSALGDFEWADALKLAWEMSGAPE